jgi:tRNA G10  N-methylase Trm11
MKSFFILGRNPKLSRHEILEFLKARNRTHKEIIFENNLLIIETNEGERFDIQKFGGIMHLGEIIFEGNSEELENYLEKNEIIPSDKFTYATFGNQDPQILKDKFKKERKIASIKHGRKLLKFQDGHKQENPKADFYIFHHSQNDTIYLATATQIYNPMEVKKRDMQKPIRREELAISPRLSKILINLSNAKPYDRLLDPFCGIGGILQEALIKKINVHGIDKDKEATEGAKQNIKWLIKEYDIKSKYEIENNDSRRAPDLQFAAIATETPLGKILTKKPSDNQAQQIIQNFEAYMVPILKRLKKVKKPSAKIAITFPVIRAFHVNAQKIAERSGLRIYMQPILESRKDQFISRDILVLQ